MISKHLISWTSDTRAKFALFHNWIEEKRVFENICPSLVGNQVLRILWYVRFGNMLFKYDSRPVVLILYSIQRCLNHHLDLYDSRSCSLYSLVCDVPYIVSVIASAGLYWTLSTLLQNESLFGWS